MQLEEISCDGKPQTAQSIAKKVQVTLTGDERSRLTPVKPVAPEVYESYLKGRLVLAQGNRAQLEQSIPLFEGALHRDGAFAPAYLGLAEAYTMLGTVSAGAGLQREIGYRPVP
ncbi:hypothetical protein [Terriglobus sp. TAA 43]|uniref:hypothetical protein n=1 Tax=Terriglobus sp. TAA 43 TaxID=278961 RepID=UPI000645CBF7|nr:hypothetical protein [Terriglobus sp. TAA 43]